MEGVFKRVPDIGLRFKIYENIMKKRALMSWETIKRDKRPCGCGQGVILTVTRMDDWNRTEHDESLQCAACEKTHVMYSYDYHSSGMIDTASKWVLREDLKRVQDLKLELQTAENLARNQMTEHLRANYLEQWMALFQNVRRNKKAVWNKLRDLGMTERSYSVFCQKVDAGRLDDLIEGYVSYLYAEPILKILEVNDKMIVALTASTNELKKKYYEARSKMLERGFR